MMMMVAGNMVEGKTFAATRISIMGLVDHLFQDHDGDDDDDEEKNLCSNENLNHGVGRPSFSRS